MECGNITVHYSSTSCGNNNNELSLQIIVSFHEYICVISSKITEFLCTVFEHYETLI